MKLENQVCSLDLARRLKELGVKQESLFYWWKYTGKPEQWMVNTINKLFREPGIGYTMHWTMEFSAFTVAELGEIMEAVDVRTGYSAIAKNYVVKYWKDDDIQ